MYLNRVLACDVTIDAHVLELRLVCDVTTDVFDDSFTQVVIAISDCFYILKDL